MSNFIAAPNLFGIRNALALSMIIASGKSDDQNWLHELVKRGDVFLHIVERGEGTVKHLC